MESTMVQFATHDIERIPLPLTRGRGLPFPAARLARPRIMHRVEWSPPPSPSHSLGALHDAHITRPPRVRRRLPHAKPARLSADAFADPPSSPLARHSSPVLADSPPIVGLGLGIGDFDTPVPVVTGMPPIYSLDGIDDLDDDPPEVDLGKRDLDGLGLLHHEQGHDTVLFTPSLRFSTSSPVSSPVNSPTILPLVPIGRARLIARRYGTGDPCSGTSSPILSPSMTGTPTLAPASPVISAPSSPVVASSPRFSAVSIFADQGAPHSQYAGQTANNENILPTVIASSVIGAVICIGAVGWLAFIMLRRRVGPPPRRVITLPVHVEDDDSLFEAKEKAASLTVRTRGTSFSAASPHGPAAWRGSTLQQANAAGRAESIERPARDSSIPMPPPVLLRSSSLTSASTISSGSSYDSRRSSEDANSSACTTLPSASTHKMGTATASSSGDLTYSTPPETPTIQRIAPTVLAGRLRRMSMPNIRAPPPTPASSAGGDSDTDTSSVLELRELIHLNEAARARVEDPYGQPPPKPQRSPYRPMQRPATMPHPPPTIFVTDHPQDLVPPPPPPPMTKDRRHVQDSHAKHESTASSFHMSAYYPPGTLFHSPSMASSFIGYVSRDDASEVDPDMAWEALKRERGEIGDWSRHSVASSADTDFSLASTFGQITETEDEAEAEDGRTASRTLFHRLRERAAASDSVRPAARRTSTIDSFPAPPRTSEDVKRPVIDPAITRFSRSDLDFDTRAFALPEKEGVMSSSASEVTVTAFTAPVKVAVEGKRSIAADLRKSISFPSGYAALAALMTSPDPTVPASVASQRKLPPIPYEDEGATTEDEDDAGSIYSRESARMSREWETARARVRARASVSLSMLVAKGTASPSMANMGSILDEEMPTAL